MITMILLLLLGLIMLLFGANYLVEGASGIAKRYKVSDFVIGVVIIGIGTSMPEMVVSVLSSIDGKGDIAVGNILGSNMFNALLILGTSALIAPILIKGKTVGKLPLSILLGVIASGVLLYMCSDMLLWHSPQAEVSRYDGIVLLIMFGAYIYYNLRYSKDDDVNEEVENVANRKLWLNSLFVLGGLAALIYGGVLFLDNAVLIARGFGLSDSVISITLIAGGTSLPELITCVIASLKGKSQMALGNVIGSNVSNIFMILGVSAVVSPLTLGSVSLGDILCLFISSVLVLITTFTFRRRYIDRVEGALFILIYMAYVWWLLVR